MKKWHTGRVYRVRCHRNVVLGWRSGTWLVGQYMTFVVFLVSHEALFTMGMMKWWRHYTMCCQNCIFPRMIPLHSLRDIANGFASLRRSNTPFNNIVGAVDGLIIRTDRPDSTGPNPCPNAQSFFTRKNCYGYNLQAMYLKIWKSEKTLCQQTHIRISVL